MKNDTIAQLAKRVMEENTFTITGDFNCEYRSIREAQQYHAVKLESIFEQGPHRATGSTQNLIDWLTKRVGLSLDEAKEQYPVLFEKKKGKCESEEEDDDEQIDEALRSGMKVRVKDNVTPELKRFAGKEGHIVSVQGKSAHVKVKGAHSSSVEFLMSELEQLKEETRLDEKRFDFKEFSEMERVITNKGILKAFDHALGLIASDLLDAGYDEKKILSFIVAMYERVM